MIAKYFLRILLTLLCGACTALPALAGASVGGGLFTQSGGGSSSSGAAIFVSSGSSLPVVPAELDVTALAPLVRGSGYAVTLEGRFSALGNAIGAGYGIGRFGSAPAGGAFTAFVDHRIAPFTSIELRGYRTTGANAASAAFLGVRFNL